MLIHTELERSGAWTLVRRQFVGVSGQVCGATYELRGPRPGLFGDLAEARAAFERARTLEVEDAA